jgi:hypothetical protein
MHFYIVADFLTLQQGVSRLQLVDMHFLVAMGLSNLECTAVYRFPNELSSPVDVTLDHTADAQISDVLAV